MSWTSAQTTVYSKQLASYIQKNLMFKNACNFAWESEAQRNKVVKINSLGTIGVETYVPGMGQISGSDVAYTAQDLTLDQYKYFNIKVDDILRATSDIFAFEPISSNGGYELAQVQDAYIAGLWGDTSTTNWIQSGSSMLINNAFTETESSASAYDASVGIAIKLDEAHAPKNERYLLAPSWFVQMMAKDSRFASFSPEVRANGIIGTVAGMTVLQTENVTSSSSIYRIMGVQKQAIAFASGLESLETMRSEKEFVTLIRALAVYGAKVTVPKYGAVLFAKKG